MKRRIAVMVMAAGGLALLLAAQPARASVSFSYFGSQVSRQNDHSLIIADNDVSRKNRHLATSDWNIDIHRMMSN